MSFQSTIVIVTCQCLVMPNPDPKHHESRRCKSTLMLRGLPSMSRHCSTLRDDLTRIVDVSRFVSPNNCSYTQIAGQTVWLQWAFLNETYDLESFLAGWRSLSNQTVLKLGSRPVHLIDFYRFTDDQSYANFSDAKKEDHFDVGESTVHIGTYTFESPTEPPFTDCIITRLTFDSWKKPFLVNRIQITKPPSPMTLKVCFRSISI